MTKYTNIKRLFQKTEQQPH